jgi:hypothetical protein
MTFLAREVGTDTWSTLASVPFTNQTVPLLPSAGAAGLGPNAEVGIDDFAVVQNSDSPVALRDEQQLSKEIWEAIAPQVRSLHGLDGAEPDYAAAQADLAEAETLLNTAIATAGAVDLGSARTRARVLAGLKKGLRSVQGAARLVAGSSRAVPALNKLRSGLTSEVAAAHLVYPADAAP